MSYERSQRSRTEEALHKVTDVQKPRSSSVVHPLQNDSLTQSTTHQATIAPKVQEKRQESSSNGHWSFVDLRKSFDLSGMGEKGVGTRSRSVSHIYSDSSIDHSANSSQDHLDDFPLSTIYASYAIKITSYILVIVFLIPVIINEVFTLNDTNSMKSRGSKAGLFQGSLGSSDVLSLVYLCYVGLTIALSPFFGTIVEGLSRHRRALFLALTSCLWIFPLLVFILLYQPQSSWKAIAILVGIMSILNELLSIPLFMLVHEAAASISFPSLINSNRISILGSKAGMAGVGTSIVVGVSVLIASIAGHHDAVQTAREACLASFIMNFCLAVYVALSLPPSQNDIDVDGQTGSGHTRQPSQSSSLGDSINNGHHSSLSHSRSHTSVVLSPSYFSRFIDVCRFLIVGSPSLSLFLLLRVFYQAALRSLVYLLTIYLTYQLMLEPSLIFRVLIVGFVSSLFGCALTYGMMTAHEKRDFKEERLNRQRRESSASLATQQGAAIAAARTAPPPLTSSSMVPSSVPKKAPLGIALIIFSISLLIFPASLDPQRSREDIAKAKGDIGLIYVLVAIWGMLMGFILTYEKAFLAHFIRMENGKQLVKIGDFAGFFVLLSSILEWLPLVLFAVVNENQRSIRGSIKVSILWILLLFLIPSFLLLIFLKLSTDEHNPGRRRLGSRHNSRGNSLSSTALASLADSSSPPDHPTFGKKMSFFLLRSLPSHLSTIVESPTATNNHTTSSSSSSSSSMASTDIHRAGRLSIG